MYGAGQFPIYSGSKYQIGGGLLSPVARYAVPLLKHVGKDILKTAAFETAKQIPKAVAAIASKTASPATALTGAVKSIAKNTAIKTLQKASSHFGANSGLLKRKRPSASVRVGGVKQKRRKVVASKRKRRDVFS